MKISELITILQIFQNEHGDLEVKCWEHEAAFSTTVESLRLDKGRGKDEPTVFIEP